MKEKITEVAVETMKQAPPLGVVTFTILGYPIADWVQLATLLYILLQAHVLCRKNLAWYQSFLDWIMRGKHVNNRKAK
ncbi:MAG: hypothetical protein [Caudoviricetes sp.]|nr:MAG: hypothetical protein [Caudoviricetes sp.]